MSFEHGPQNQDSWLGQQGPFRLGCLGLDIWLPQLIPTWNKFEVVWNTSARHLAATWERWLLIRGDGELACFTVLLTNIFMCEPGCPVRSWTTRWQCVWSPPSFSRIGGPHPSPLVDDYMVCPFFPKSVKKEASCRIDFVSLANRCKMKIDLANTQEHVVNIFGAGI